MCNYWQLNIASLYIATRVYAQSNLVKTRNCNALSMSDRMVDLGISHCEYVMGAQICTAAWTAFYITVNGQSLWIFNHDTGWGFYFYCKVTRLRKCQGEKIHNIRMHIICAVDIGLTICILINSDLTQSDCLSVTFIWLFLSLSLLWIRFLHLPVVCDVFEKDWKLGYEDK